MNQQDPLSSPVYAATSTTVESGLQPEFTFANAPAQPQKKKVEFHNPISKKAAIIGVSSFTAFALVVGTFAGVSNFQKKAKQAEIQRTSRVVVL